MYDSETFLSYDKMFQFVYKTFNLNSIISYVFASKALLLSCVIESN